MIVPSPWQVSHRPPGVLNEKWAGVAATRTAQRVLVHKLNITHQVQTAVQMTEITGMLGKRTAVMLLQCRVEYLAHQTRLAAPAHACYHRHHMERKTNRQVLEVVLASTFHLNVRIRERLLHESGARLVRRHADAAHAGVDRDVDPDLLPGCGRGFFQLDRSQ